MIALAARVLRLGAHGAVARRMHKLTTPCIHELRIGTAGWAIPRLDRMHFPDAGSRLARYATQFSTVEINSSFRRPHRRATYERWGREVPETFRFCVKLPKTITHDQRLVATEALLDGFLADVTALGDRLGCLLVQLPPSLAFDPALSSFFETLRQRVAQHIVVEPRHASWMTGEVDALLSLLQVARVAADPALDDVAARPGGWPGLAYYRLHGSPRMYYSSYDAAWLTHFAAVLSEHRAAGTPVWCIFDNTAHGAATGNALQLAKNLAAGAAVAG
jgi:uncharacterized protein YecE (DUF72 family)